MAHQVQDCHWSVPTLLMPRPYWLSAVDSPWSCWNECEITVLPSTDGCADCPFFRERAVPHSAGQALFPDGAIPLTHLV